LRHLLPGVDGNHAFVERFGERTEPHLFGLERLDPAGQLLREPMHRIREIADLAGCRERRTAPQVTCGERARHIAQLHDRPRHRSRERPDEPKRQQDRENGREQHVGARAREQRLNRGGADRDPREAAARPNGPVELLVAGRRAHPA